MKRKMNGLEIVIALLIAGVLQVIGALVIVQYWQWFIMASIPDAPNMTPTQALAISLTLNLVLPSENVQEPWEYLLRGAIRLISALIIGAVFYILFFAAGS